MLERFSRGRQVEAEQLEKMGLEKNTKPFDVEVDGKPIRTVPDAMRTGPNGGKQTVEIKNVKSQSKTSQLKAQEKISNSNGERPVLRINRNVNRISKPVQDAFDIEYYQVVPTVPKDNTTRQPAVDPSLKKPSPPEPCEGCI